MSPFNMFGRGAAVLLSALLATLVPFANATADPVQRFTIDSGPIVFPNPCNATELLEATGEITLMEKDTFREGSQHFFRQILGKSTLVNLTSGDLYRSVSHSTNIFHWPDQTGVPPLTYIYRVTHTYVQPGSGMQIRFRETIRMVINPDGTIVVDVGDRTVTCR